MDCATDNLNQFSFLSSLTFCEEKHSKIPGAASRGQSNFWKLIWMQTRWNSENKCQAKHYILTHFLLLTVLLWEHILFKFGQVMFSFPNKTFQCPFNCLSYTYIWIGIVVDLSLLVLPSHLTLDWTDHRAPWNAFCIYSFLWEFCTKYFFTGQTQGCLTMHPWMWRDNSTQL